MKLCYDSKGNPYIQQYHKKIANVIDIDECNDLVDTYNSITSIDELNNEIEELEDTISSLESDKEDLEYDISRFEDIVSDILKSLKNILNEEDSDYTRVLISEILEKYKNI